jgi:hypothetical protein
VEIDPAVYNAARRWFMMPAPSQLFLEDARNWVAGRRRILETHDKQDLFDIVVHDCFSGGGVPEHIFTMEFWVDLRALMVPNGVLAVVGGCPHFMDNKRAEMACWLELCWETALQICTRDPPYPAIGIRGMSSVSRFDKASNGGAVPYRIHQYREFFLRQFVVTFIM